MIKKEYIIKLKEKVEGKIKAQETLIEALLKGNFNTAKTLIENNKGLSLKTAVERNGKKLLPLTAAVFGMNLEAVKFIEKQLGETEFQRQWKTEDIRNFINEPAFPSNINTEKNSGLLKFYSSCAKKAGAKDMMLRFKSKMVMNGKKTIGSKERNASRLSASKKC